MALFGLIHLPAALIRCLNIVRIPILIFSLLLSSLGMSKPISLPENERAETDKMFKYSEDTNPDLLVATVQFRYE